MDIKTISAYVSVGTVAVSAIIFSYNMFLSVRNIETATTVDRIVRLNKIECDSGLSAELHIVLQDNLTRYKQLAGREFTKPRCSTD